ncbi:MAG: Ig-like domain-containing protein, partial [Marinobacter sp.]
TATTDLRALCDEEGDLVKTLTENDSAAFMTGSEVDSQGPSAVTSSPEDGETLAPTDTNIFVEFDEEIDPQSVNENNFTVTEIDENGNPVGTIEGVINPVGNSIEFNPDSNLSFQTTYEIMVDTTITDLAGNGLEQSATFTFRTGGLVVLLDNTLLGDPAIAQSEGFDSGILVEGLHTLGGTLLSALEFGD